MNPLLVEPTELQAELLRIVWDGYNRGDDWPIYQFVALRMYQEHGCLDAWDVVRSCPEIRFHVSPASYGWLWLENGGTRFPRDEDRVGITVVGMSASNEPGMAPIVRVFLRTLGGFVQAERNVRPSPTEVRHAEFSADQVRETLLPPLPSSTLTLLGTLLKHEPSTWSYITQTADTWAAKVDSRIHAFEGIETVPQYVDRLTEIVSPRDAAAPPVLVSSLALPEAIDYLNAVWRLHHPRDLFRLARAKAVAELSHDCQTADEFDSRMTALYGIFCQTQIPGRTRDSKPTDLKQFLARHLSPEAVPRANAAVDTLGAFLRARAWRQHTDATDGLTAMYQLGVRVPIEDWALAWRVIQARIVAALNALREEIELIGMSRT